MTPNPAEVTQLLHQWRAGDPVAENLLFNIVLPELRRLAQMQMRKERPGHSLDPTALVNEIYFKLSSARHQDWQNRGHFFAVAARAMRRYLIDYARARRNGEKVPLDGAAEALAGPKDNFEQAVLIDVLLDKMGNAEWCRIVEFKYFLGLTDDEAAELMGINVRKFQREWFDARRWLFDQLKGDGATAPGPPAAARDSEAGSRGASAGGPTR